VSSHKYFKLVTLYCNIEIASASYHTPCFCVAKSLSNLKFSCTDVTRLSRSCKYSRTHEQNKRINWIYKCKQKLSFYSAILHHHHHHQQQQQQLRFNGRFIYLFIITFSTWIWVIQSPLGCLLPLATEENLWGQVTQVFYELDDLPVTQQTVSNHWRKLKALTPTNGLASSFLHPPLDSRGKGR